ncbi:MAG: hypothetical protein HC783_17470 [Rhodobacteraceae bacterium]|nr:hypothetical protein [Paracoccaceae bacterium]
MWIRALAAILCLLASPLLAEAAETDGVAVTTLLPDAALYRLATCGAPPGGPARAKCCAGKSPA